METSPSPPHKPLDPLVKTALTICISLIVVTVVGMILTAPDRSIPPYSVVAQLGEVVTVNVPPRTTDAEVEALLVRFQAVGREDRSRFGRLKIKPTTPDDPSGRYQRVTVYIFDNLGLAEEPALKDYVRGGDPASKAGFERGVRGVYRVTPEAEFGALGFAPEGRTPSASTARARVLFQGKLAR
jgi:hypothetical protein